MSYHFDQRMPISRIRQCPCELRSCLLLAGFLVAVAGMGPAGWLGQGSWLSSVRAEEVVRPRVLLDGWQLQLIDHEPTLVTPVSCRFDAEGNLYVVECHTHFPPEDYAGPKADRIFVYRQRQPDGSFQERLIFHEGTRATMGLAVTEEGWVYVATREEILRMRDTTGDGRADRIEPLIRHKTAAEYPHNGLSGLSLSADGYLYFGQGENFGEPFTIEGTDGSRQTGSGEGGNVYRCRLDGTGVERIATGIWNPFGLCFDNHHRLWCVDNDPDARPPCRLLHIVPSADFGFQFRFGRAGTNPLLAWDGELPGTLPMAAGTGEAPCEVVAYGQHLWVTSWGDNRIERFRLEPNGATLRGNMEVVVQGTADFRPVSFAVADDGSIYFTDWVDRSYPVHGRGRLWRLVPDQPGSPETDLPLPSPAETLAARFIWGQASQADFEQAMLGDDVYLRHAAGLGIAAASIGPVGETTNERIERLRVARWRILTAVVDESLDEVAYRNQLREAAEAPELPVRLLAVRYMAESGQQEFIRPLERRLQGGVTEVDEFDHLVAAISFLQTGSASGSRRDPARDRLLAELFTDSSQPIELRGLALRNLPSQAEVIEVDGLIDLLKDSNHAAMHREILALLAERRQPEVSQALQGLLLEPLLNAELRADVLAVLSADSQWLEKSWDEQLKQRLSQLAVSSQAWETELERIDRWQSGSQADQSRPPVEDLENWYRLVGQGGDARRGWRVWVRSQCVQCHALHGRGASVGPELSTLARTTQRQRVLQSIIDPSREVAPLYAAWQILTTDGRVLTGAKLNESGVGQRAVFLAADGTTFEVALADIESQQVSSRSIMPENAIENLTLEELSDLLELLSPSAQQ